MNDVGKENSSLVPYKEQGIERGIRLPSFFKREKPRNEADEYRTLIEAIEHSSDPVGTALNGLFKANGVNYEHIERKMLEAGVKMYPRFEEEVEGLLPKDITSFVNQFYGGNEKLHIREIIVERTYQHHEGIKSYAPYILIEVETVNEEASELEKKTRQIFSPEGNLLGGRTIHLRPDQGEWKASAMLWDSSETDEKGLPVGESTVSKIDVDLSLIRSIAKMVPVDPTDTLTLSRIIALTPLN